MGLTLKDKKIEPMNILIDFFAFQYDMVHSLVVFLIEYVKWITDLRSNNSLDFNTPAKELIQIQNQNQNPFDIR